MVSYRYNILLIASLCFLAAFSVAVEDNEFAEFDDVDDEAPEFETFDEGTEGDVFSNGEGSKDHQQKLTTPKAPEGEDEEFEDAAVEVADDEFEPVHEEEDATVETEEEFDPFGDDEEFEHATGRESRTDQSQDPAKDQSSGNLRFAKVPPSMRRWQAFYLEIMMGVGIFVYLLNFLVGKSRNSSLAQAWFKANSDILQQNFAVVGDDGSGEELTSGVLVKESDSSFMLWCTGRVAVQGMLCSLKLLKRQDIISTLGRIAKPASDQLTIKITLDDSEMDSFVFAIAHKKSAAKLHKDMQDLSTYVTDRKSPSKQLGIPDSYYIMSELAEVTTAIIDTKMRDFLDRHEGVVDYIHISDQFSGARASEDGEAVKPPETSKCIILNFNLGKKGFATTKDMVESRTLMFMALHMMEKVRKFRLSREAKAKSEKGRAKAQSVQSKQAHQQRQEAAQARKEEKLRAEKERYMTEKDPEKAIKLKEKYTNKTEKKKQPKGKMIKMKAA